MIFIDFFSSVLLSLVYGLTSFLPISPDGHFILLNNYIRFTETQQNFSLLLIASASIGGFAGFIVICGKKLNPIAHDSVGIKIRPRKLLTWGRILVPFIPFLIIGIIFKDRYTSLSLRPAYLAAEFAITGILLFLFSFMAGRRNTRPLRIADLKISPALLIFSIPLIISIFLPGHSALSLIVLTGLFVGMDEKNALSYAYYLYFLTLIFSISVRLFSTPSEVLSFAELLYLIIGGIVAFIASCIGIKFMLKAKTRSLFIGFGIYQFILAIAVFYISRS